jgi:hypothetical protein
MPISTLLCFVQIRQRAINIDYFQASLCLPLQPSPSSKSGFDRIEIRKREVEGLQMSCAARQILVREDTISDIKKKAATLTLSRNPIFVH